MREVFIDILKGLGAIALTFFLPKHILLCIREILKFGANAIVKYWYVSLSVIGIALVLNNKFEFTKTPYSVKLISVTIFLVFAITFFIALFKSLQLKTKALNATVYGCFSTKDKEYLHVDIDAESLNEKLLGLCEKYNSSMSIFRSGLLRLEFVEFPKFLPIILGYKGLNKKIQTRVNKGNHLFSLHFIREINEQKLSVNIKYDKSAFVNPEFIEKVIRIINIFVEKSDFSYIKASELSFKLVTLIFSQSLVDMLIQAKNYKEVHNILSDSESLLSEINNELSIISISESKEEISKFYLVWKAVIERYKSVLLIEQEQYAGAIQYIFKSASLNPYYPYDNYESFKRFYSKKYALSLSHSLEETSELFNEGEKKDYSSVRDNLSQQIHSVDATFNSEVIKEIILRDKSERIIKLIEEELSKLNNSNPALLLLKSDVVKYLPKGDEKFNEIYVARFDDCILPLKEILKLDNEFPLLHAKVGALLSCKGMHFGNESLMREGVAEFSTGMHLYTEFGFDK